MQQTQNPPGTGTARTRRRCSSCRFGFFWREYEDGQCRRRPPARNETSERRWPAVGHDQWCGEYQARESS